jgi:hypothetical protein
LGRRSPRSSPCLPPRTGPPPHLLIDDSNASPISRVLR